jgi:putative phosphoesterase
VLIGLLSDAHGNPLGLRACLAALRGAGVDRLFFLGDAVGYLFGEAEVLRELRDCHAECVRGNHEGMLLGALALDPARDEAYGLADVRARLSVADRELIEAWPERRELELDGRRILLVHGSPWQPLTGYVYPDSDLEPFAEIKYDAVFMGNTHRPFVAHRGGTLVANVGSCGLPRDEGDLMACAVYDTATGECRVLRVRLGVDEILGQYPDRAPHQIVSDCLLRKAAGGPFGIVVPRV